MGSDAVLVVQTTDGGLTWHQVATTPPLNAPTIKPLSNGIPLGGDKTGISFRDTATGWITGATNLSGTIWLYVSHDGGRSWQPQHVALPSEFPSSALTMTDPPRFFGTGDGLLLVIVNDRTLLLYMSHDGGQSWQPTTPVRFGEKSSGRLIDDFVDPTHGWASDGLTLYQTTNGARDWKKLSPNFPLTWLTQLDFVSQKVGWAILAPPRSASRLLTTTDGGKSWTAIQAETVPP